MRVYLVIYQDYDEFRIDAVCTSIEAAKQEAEALQVGAGSYASVISQRNEAIAENERIAHDPEYVRAWIDKWVFDLDARWQKRCNDLRSATTLTARSLFDWNNPQVFTRPSDLASGEPWPVAEQVLAREKADYERQRQELLAGPPRQDIPAIPALNWQERGHTRPEERHGCVLREWWLYHLDYAIYEVEVAA